MSICNIGCLADVPSLTVCDIPVRVSPIGNIGIFACNAGFDRNVTLADGVTEVPIGPITDPQSWQDLIDNNLFALSPNIGGSKPATTQTTEDVPCAGPIIIGEQHTIVIDSIVAPADYSDYTYWQNVRTNYLKYKMAYFDCCGTLYGSACDADAPFFGFTTDVQPITEKSSTAVVRWQGNVTFNYIGVPTPIILDPTVVDLLGFQCETC